MEHSSKTFQEIYDDFKSHQNIYAFIADLSKLTRLDQQSAAERIFETIGESGITADLDIITIATWININSFFPREANNQLKNLVEVIAFRPDSNYYKVEAICWLISNTATRHEEAKKLTDELKSVSENKYTYDNLIESIYDLFENINLSKQEAVGLADILKNIAHDKKYTPEVFKQVLKLFKNTDLAEAKSNELAGVLKHIYKIEGCAKNVINEVSLALQHFYLGNFEIKALVSVLDEALKDKKYTNLVLTKVQEIMLYPEIETEVFEQLKDLVLDNVLHNGQMPTEERVNLIEHQFRYFNLTPERSKQFTKALADIAKESDKSAKRVVFGIKLLITTANLSITEAEDLAAVCEEIGSEKAKNVAVKLLEKFASAEYQTEDGVQAQPRQKTKGIK